ncbi:MAG: hypothetical protein AAFW73_23860 [Bacteroidota bacterium]
MRYCERGTVAVLSLLLSCLFSVGYGQGTVENDITALKYPQSFTHTDWFAKDTLARSRYGISISPALLLERFSTTSVGFDVALGGYYDRRVLERVIATLGGGIQYAVFDQNIFQTAPARSGDTATVHNFYRLEQNLVKLATPIDFRFFYLFKPPVYVLLGLRPEWLLYRRTKPVYERTVYRDERFNYLGEEIRTDAVFQELSHPFFSVKISLGFGLSLNATDVEMGFDYDFFDAQPARLKLRVRQRLGSAR